ncbi:MAG: surface lipoprotein assembly modifier [Alphaproteobacteria bacterium]
MPYGFNFYINAMYSHNTYHTSGTFVLDNEFHTTTRRDNTYQIYTRIYNSYINLYNFIPAISYTYAIRQSNIPTYDRHTHQAMLEIVRMF